MIAAPAVHPVKGTVGSFARVEWGRLFHEHYLAANPHLRSGPTIDPGCYTGGQPTTDSLPRYRSFRTAMVGGPNAFQREADACTPALLKQIKFAQSNGFKSLLWTNIRVSPATVPSAPSSHQLASDVTPRCCQQGMDAQAHSSEDPLGDYRHFPDSFAKKDGKFVRCWDGVSMNPAPEFSYGVFLFKRLTAWVLKYNFDVRNQRHILTASLFGMAEHVLCRTAGDLPRSLQRFR